MDRKRRLWPWIVAALVMALVVYPLSMGPALWLKFELLPRILSGGELDAIGRAVNDFYLPHSLTYKTFG